MGKPGLDIRIARALDLVGETGHPQDGQGLPRRNAPSPLRVFLPFVKSRGARRQRRLLDAAPPDAGGGSELSLPADGAWHDAGLQLQAGERVQITATGRLFLNRALEVSIGPRTCLWYRIGEGPIARLRQQQQVIVADRAGVLRLQAALPGAFESPDGETNRESPPPPMSGELQVALQPLEGGALTPAVTPPGWHYLWRIGEAAIFSQCDDNAICCDTHGDVGILQYPIELPLDDTLSLHWEWLMESLPSTLPEHIQPTHDYLSIAVEFDNGLDLTYMWSSQLPAGTIFQCPLPWWDKRETHWVLRTPADGLQQWLGESRSLREDYRQAIGGPLPGKIVQVWLIANSAFQNGRGVCRYRNIRMANAAGLHPICGE